MKYKLNRISSLSGTEASIYTVLVENEQNKFEKSLFDIFLSENKISHKSEVNNIIIRLKTIGHDIGARESFFKLKEGKPGDGVCALYDSPHKQLRLYCIRFGKDLVIVGGGGIKKVRALQDDAKLKKENYLLRELSTCITKALKSGELNFSKDYLDFEGNMIIDNIYEE